MDVPEVAPAVLGEIITMAVAPVFLISALIVLLGLLSSRSMRIIDSIFELAGERALSPHDPLLALQKRRLRHISLAFREAVIATAMVCLVVLLLFLNVMVAMDLAPLCELSLHCSNAAGDPRIDHALPRTAAGPGCSTPTPAWGLLSQSGASRITSDVVQLISDASIQVDCHGLRSWG
tara:strand:- start:87 stop:620 length:534 start_codon:yes stop_codon:yes gene_type:complete